MMTQIGYVLRVCFCAWGSNVYSPHILGYFSISHRTFPVSKGQPTMSGYLETGHMPYQACHHSRCFSMLFYLPCFKLYVCSPNEFFSVCECVCVYVFNTLSTRNELKLEKLTTKGDFQERSE